MPSHRTPSDARIGDSRGGHIVRSPGKGGGPVSIKRPDAQPDNPQVPEAPFRPGNSVVVGENPGVIADRRR